MADHFQINGPVGQTARQIQDQCNSGAFAQVPRAGGTVDEISILGRELKMKKSVKFQRIIAEHNLRPAQLLKIGDMVSDVLYAS